MDTELLEKFVRQINDIKACITPGCSGKLVPVSITNKGLGGALSVTYVCDGCEVQKAQFDTSYVDSGRCVIGQAVQVAFIAHCKWLYACYISQGLVP